MALPPSATKIARAFDPADKADFQIGLSGLLTGGEEMVAHTLIMSAEGAALGVSILNSGGYQPVVGADDIQFWIEVDEANRADPAFEGAGTPISMELTIETNSVPSRRFQRTIYFTVAQQ